MQGHTVGREIVWFYIACDHLSFSSLSISFFVAGWLEGVASYTVVQPAIDLAIRTAFYKLLKVVAKLYTLRMPKFSIRTFGNLRNNCETVFIWLFVISSRGITGFFCIGAIFTKVNAPVKLGIPSLFYIPISFVHMGPISMLNNRPCHGPWTGLGDSALWRFIPGFIRLPNITWLSGHRTEVFMFSVHYYVEILRVLFTIERRNLVSTRGLF